jgi:glycogen synthase
MRVLVLTNLYPPVVLGGYERACANVVQGLVERGHEVSVLTTWSHLPCEGDPSYVHRRLDLRWLLSPSIPDVRITDHIHHESNCSLYANTQHLIEALRSERPDIVYVWNLLGVGAAALLDILNIANVPWVLHLMDAVPYYITANVPPYIQSVFNARGGSLYASARVISMSQHLLDEIFEKTNIRFAPPPAIIPGWVDLTYARPHGAYLQGNVARFVTAGRVAEEKGIGLIVEASSILRREGVTNFSVDVYGEGNVAFYVAMANNLGVGDIIRFAGPRSQRELMDSYAAYDAFLFPTWEREPFGLAPVEAAGCGAPPILTRNCGVSERFVDRVHCLNVERSSADLARAMGAVASNEVDLPRLASRAERMIRKDLSFANCLDRIEAVLDSARTGWDHSRLDEAKLPLLAFLKHNLSVTMRYGWS